jgi:hypothetical protein
MKGKYDKADAVDPNFLNHVTWYSATDWKRPYPEKTSCSCLDYLSKPPRNTPTMMMTKANCVSHARFGADFLCMSNAAKHHKGSWLSKNPFPEREHVSSCLQHLSVVEHSENV